jgi:hypothetical protein
MNKNKVFTDLFGRKFKFADNNLNEDELNVYENLGTKWTLIAIFSGENKKPYLIEYFSHLLTSEIPFKDLVRHDNEVMSILIYKGILNASQLSLIQEIKDNAKV